jgi:hypothetical protein
MLWCCCRKLGVGRQAGGLTRRLEISRELPVTGKARFVMETTKSRVDPVFARSSSFRTASDTPTPLISMCFCHAQVFIIICFHAYCIEQGLVGANQMVYGIG